MSCDGDQVYRKLKVLGRWDEVTFAGVISFLRRKYSRDLEGIDVAVSGVPYDGATTYRPGCRFGPRPIREASVQLVELNAFPFGFDPLEKLAVVDWGDAEITALAAATVAHDWLCLLAKKRLKAKCGWQALKRVTDK